MKKRLLSILLCTALMILSMLAILPMTAFAGDDPASELTPSEAATITAGLEHNVPSTATYSVTGYVTQTVGSVSKGQQSFWLDDEKGDKKTFEAYWCNLPANENPLNVGDKVTIVGKFMRYNSTYEIKNGDVTILERNVPNYNYTKYENWQIKYGGSWEWSDNMEKVEDGLYKIEILWEGTGFNVKSDENPIKKDWYALEDLTRGEEVIAPTIVDVYLRVIDDETLRIGVGVEPAPAHTHDPVLVNGQAATETEAGWNDYYRCDCGLYFEDEDCETKIGDEAALATWKAEGGNGYVAPTGGNGEKANLWWLWVLIAVVVVGGAGAAVYFFVIKKKKQ